MPTYGSLVFGGRYSRSINYCGLYILLTYLYLHILHIYKYISGHLAGLEDDHNRRKENITWHVEVQTKKGHLCQIAESFKICAI